MKRYQLPPELTENRTGPFIVAHRGNRAQAPENSMAAFRLALEQGADALETDLHITRDRVIVCMHDATVDRTTDGTGPIQEKTLEEMKALTLKGAGEDQYPDEHPPTLDELLAAFADQTQFLLELKNPGWTTAEDIHLLAETLQRHNARDKAILASFNFDILNAVEKHAGYDAATTPIMITNLIPPKRFPFIGVWWPNLFMNPFYVWIAHRRGQIFCPLDPTPEPRLRYYLWLGVDGILTDNPELTRQELDKHFNRLVK